MPNNTITNIRTKRETSYTVTLIPSDLTKREWAFLREWASNLSVTVEVLLKRILFAGIAGSHYAEKIPEK